METHGVEGRPSYPPVPVGAAIKLPGKKGKYYAWGHVTGNNCTWPEARAAIGEAYACKDGVLFQNGKFDVDVIEVHMDLQVPAWDRIHDTMFLLFLDDPHQSELGLKPSAERLLGMPPEEQDEVAEWLVAHQPVQGIKISKSKSSDHYFMKYLPYAPGDLVGRYAVGDIDRTDGIFQLLWPKTVERGMLAAYDRERELMPCLLDMERQGVPVDLKRLRNDVRVYQGWYDHLTDWVRRQLRAPDLNVDSGEQLMLALIQTGNVDEQTVPRTPTGKFQTNKEALSQVDMPPVIRGMLRYRSQLGTCLHTFMEPWLRTAEASGGLIFTSWNQVRSPGGGDVVGARTGRLSSTPNFQNIPNEFIPTWRHEETDKKRAKLLPICPIRDLPALPRVRSYVVPFPGEVLIDRDYSQQELRILGHFEGGVLMDKYLEDPWLDVHDDAKAELESMGLFYDRKPVKNTNFGLIYGMGVGKLAMKNDTSVEDAKTLKNAILSLYPGLKQMYHEMKVRAKTEQPIRTWGGREYYCEPPRMVNGKRQEFDYKLVNVLVQGSAADCTKDSIIRFYKAKKPTWKLLLNVHDQLTSSVPKADRDEAMEVKRQCMEAVEFSVPMLSEGSWSAKTWEDLQDYDKKGVRV